MNTVLDRLILIRANKGFTITTLAQLFSEKRQRLQDIESGKQKIPEDIIYKYIEYLHMNAHWLFTGKGEMYKNPKSFDNEDIDKEFENFCLIPFFDIEASAGHGSLIEQEQKLSEMAFRKDWLAQQGLISSQCALIKARGDSMEPTLHDGDLLLVDTRIDAIKDDSIYILQADHHLIVKRVQLTLDGTLVIISDNPRYETQTLTLEQAKEVKVVGRLRWYGHEI